MQSRPSANHNLAITNHALTPVKASLSASSQSPVYLPVSINLFPIGAADSENQNPIIVQGSISGDRRGSSEDSR